jgi:hypothetical protein
MSLLLLFHSPQDIILSGTTRDEFGAPLGACSVMAFKTSTRAFVAETTSDVDGAYTLTLHRSIYFLVAYKTGSPDVAGTTLNTLTAVP